MAKPSPRTDPRTDLRAALVAGILLGPALGAGAPPALAQQAAVPPDFTGIVRQKMPAVVAILTKQMLEEQAEGEPDEMSLRDLFRRRFGGQGPRQQPRTALGSGFVVSSDGHIVTNNHVVENASEIHVRFADKTDVPARLVGRDPGTDLAVLKVEGRPNLAPVAWGDSEKM